MVKSKRLIIILLLYCAIFTACKDKQESQIQVPPEPPKAAEAVKREVATPKPPEIISLKLSPQSPKVGDEIKAEVVTDGKDGGVIYQWWKNNTLLDETSDTLKTELKRSDIILVSATPVVEGKKGKAVNAFTYVFNSRPKIISSSIESKFEGNTYTYQVKAIDPDGDALTYSINTAPKDMKIDPSTGLITWNVNPQDFTAAGKHTVVVRVSDGRGGLAEEVFYVSIGQK